MSPAVAPPVAPTRHRSLARLSSTVRCTDSGRPRSFAVRAGRRRPSTARRSPRPRVRSRPQVRFPSVPASVRPSLARHLSRRRRRLRGLLEDGRDLLVTVSSLSHGRTHFRLAPGECGRGKRPEYGVVCQVGPGHIEQHQRRRALAFRRAASPAVPPRSAARWPPPGTGRVAPAQAAHVGLAVRTDAPSFHHRLGLERDVSPKEARLLQQCLHDEEPRE